MNNQEFIESIRLEGEEWRDVVGWDNYFVSSYGRIVSKFYTYDHDGIMYHKNASILKPTHNGGKPGYLTVMLSAGKYVRKRISVHKIVATAFIPNPDDLPVINHKDENTLNNRADNLEWCTQAYNNAYGTHRIRAAATQRYSAPKRKEVVQLTISGEMIEKYDSIAFASENTGIPRTTIDNAILHRCVSRGKFRWMYLSDYEKLIASMSKNSSILEMINPSKTRLESRNRTR